MSFAIVCLTLHKFPTILGIVPMEPPVMPPFHSIEAGSARMGSGVSDEVVEIGLLLPAHRAEALLALSRQRRQSVGQILRSLIEQAISNPDA